MRKAFVRALETLMPTNPDMVVLLGDIGVMSMADLAAQTGRVHNYGIREQSMVNVAAGLSLAGKYPIVHTIEPFLCERAIEQIKLFALNQCNGMFVTCGGSYEYSTLGPTHHCPASVAYMSMVPGMTCMFPSDDAAVQNMMTAVTNVGFKSDGPVWLRLSDRPQYHGEWYTKGPDPEGPVIITMGPLGALVQPDMQYSAHINIMFLFHDINLPREISRASRFLIVEDCYQGTLAAKVVEAVSPRPVTIKSIGIPPGKFVRGYESREHFDRAFGFTPENVRQHLEALYV